MADSLQIRGGNKSSMPTLADRELGYCKDEKTLHIGTPSGNQKIADAAVFEKITALQTRATNLENAMGNKLTASKAASQTDLASDADLATVISAYNGLLAALRTAGIMTT